MLLRFINTRLAKWFIQKDLKEIKEFSENSDVYWMMQGFVTFTFVQNELKYDICQEMAAE